MVYASRRLTPYGRLDDENRWDSIFDLLGDLDPETADPYDLELAEDYLLECLYQTEDAETFNTALVDLAEEAIWFNGHRQPQPKGPMFTIGPWIVTQDGDPDAAAIYNRHYSAKPNRTSTLFVGPGEKLVLVTPEYDALFSWRISKHRADGQWGAECTIFRNESTRLSSDLIAWAENAAILEWPYVMRFYTFVDPARVKSSNPGYSFLKAGWRRRNNYRTRKRNLLLLDKIFVPDKLIGDSIWPTHPNATAASRTSI